MFSRKNRKIKEQSKSLQSISYNAQIKWFPDFEDLKILLWNMP